MVVRRSAEWGQRATENAPLVRSRRNISFLALASFFVRGLLVKVWELTYGDGDDKPVPLVDTVRSPEQPSALSNLEREEMRDLLADSLGQLTQQERLVVALYYYEELTLKEIGQVLELSESRVSQLHTKAVLSLRVKLRKRFMA